MNRRNFLLQTLTGSLAGLTWPAWAASGADSANPAAVNIKDLFVCEDPQILRLAEDIFRQCVLAKIKPPEGTMKHRWLTAGTGEAFYGQWIWDTMFIVDLLAILP